MFKDTIDTNNDFAERLIALAEEFDHYDFIDCDGNDEDVLDKTRESIINDLNNHNDEWIRNWLSDVMNELTEKTNNPNDTSEGADYLGHYICECIKLTEYLNK